MRDFGMIGSYCRKGHFIFIGDTSYGSCHGKEVAEAFLTIEIADKDSELSEGNLLVRAEENIAQAFLAADHHSWCALG